MTYTLRNFDSAHRFNLTADIRYSKPLFELTYILKSTGTSILIPQSNQSPQFKNELWKHTCFEFFIKNSGKNEYCEFNFSPSSDWACYFFNNYRDQSFEFHDLSPQISFKVNSEEITLKSTFDISKLSSEILKKIDFNSKLSFNITAVLEHPGGTKSYWAPIHKNEKPDFHWPECFQPL